MAMNNKKVRFGFADVLIILLVLALAGGGFWYFFGGVLFGSGEGADIAYEVRLTAVRNEFTQKLHVGDKVYDPVYGEYIGVIEKYEHRQYTEQVLNKETGELVRSVKDGYYDLYITVRADAKLRDNAYYVEETEIRVGQSVYLRTADFCGEGYCTALAEIGGGES